MLICPGIVYPAIVCVHPLSVEAFPQYDYHWWTHTYSGKNTTRALAVVETSGGGFALTGLTCFSPDLSDADLWLIGTDHDGNQIWSQICGGNGMDVGSDLIEVSTGGFAVVGSTQTPSTGLYDAWLIRTDAAGNQMWDKTFGGSENEGAYAIVECSDGGFAIAGITNGSGAGQEDVWLIRTDDEGELLWDQTYGCAGVDRGYDLVERSTGGFAIVGITDNTGPICVGYLVLTDEDGNQEGQTISTSTTLELWAELAECSDGGYAIAGWMITTSGDDDCSLIRTDATGHITWEQHYGGSQKDRGYALTLISSIGFAIAGYSRSFATGSAGDEDTYIVCTDEDGVQQWYEHYGTADMDGAEAIIECASGGFAIAGYCGWGDSGIRDACLIRISDTPQPLGIPGFPWETIGIALVIALATGLTRRQRHNKPRSPNKN